MQVVEQNSIVTSLSELRDIERQRIADEVAAYQRAEAARIAAREAAERRAREEEEARARAEREAQLAAEQARLEAEREERRRIDTAAALELARQQVALDHQRMQRELELREQEVARTRPTWMKAVVVLALAAAGAMLWLSLSSRSIAAQAGEQARLARLDREQAREAMEAAQAGLAEVRRELEDNSRTIQGALEDLGRARTQAERDAIDARLRREAERLRAIEKRRAEAEAIRLKKERIEKVVIPKQCEDTPFAPGCDGR